MTLIERDHLLAHMQDLIKDHGTFRVLCQILKLKLISAPSAHALAIIRICAAIGLPPEHKPPDLFKTLL